MKIAQVTTNGFAIILALFLIIKIVNGQSSKQQKWNKLSGKLLDPNGPLVQFILYTRNFPPVNLKIGDKKALQSSGFNATDPTKIIIHGFASSIEGNIFQLPKNAYLQAGNFNVIGVDWSVLCEFDYLSAMRGMRKAGENLASFINWLQGYGVPLDKIHIIGHSMGAHVAGTGGGGVKNGKVARITGLDPAGPGYTDMRTEYKLDRNDAKLVDVIHTHMRVLSLVEPLGHLDFYPNGGHFQPGCPEIYDIWKFVDGMLCNHGRSYELFAESIGNKRAFRSFHCKTVNEAVNKSCTEKTDVYMGQEGTYNKTGVFYFRTRAIKPYSF